MFSKKRRLLKEWIPPQIGIIRNSNGLSILELIVAFVILQVALVTFAQFVTAALDYSRKVRRTEMAQILAQAKMEELLRTIPTKSALSFPSGETETAQLLNEKPGNFDDLAHALSEDIAPFNWVAEGRPSASNPKVLDVTLYVYLIDKRLKSGKASEPIEDFYVSDNRKWFTFTHTLDDDSIEVIHGKEKLRVSSALALP